jgi:transposase
MELLDSGLSLNEVGRRLRCAPISVQRWRDARKAQGTDGLKPLPVPGRPGKLRASQRRKLVKLLVQGALASGYHTDLWTTARVVEVIAQNFGISYHRDHIGRLLHSLGFSWQKPQKRAVERNEAAIEKWKREDWPRIKKTPKRWVHTSPSSTNPASC